MNHFSFIRFSFFVAVASLAACAVPREGEQMTLVSPEGERIAVQVEIADNPRERAQGLMFRESLQPDAGMLFVYEAERPLSFWMKNTLIPLDILFFDADGRLISTTTMEPCKKDPCRNYPSEGSALFALEVSAGFVDAHDVGKGWRMTRP